jgi:hypothetical protein
MILKELFEPAPPGYNTDNEDNSVLKLSDLRKTRLTLSQLQKLRQMNDVKKYEYEEKIKDIVKQYSPAETSAAPGSI